VLAAHAASAVIGVSVAGALTPDLRRGASSSRARCGPDATWTRSTGLAVRAAPPAR
jgi:hypothetical protein